MSAIEQLNDAVEAMMATPGAPLAPLPPHLAAIMRIASALRDLPRPAFKAQLRAALLAAQPAGAAPRYGGALVSDGDIRARLEELAAEPRFVAYDLGAALSDLPEMTMRFLVSLNQCTIGVSRMSAPSHWERHTGGDELLHVLEGAVDITTLTGAGPVASTARAGSLFVCPRGLWHRLRPRAPVSLLFATPGEGTERSNAEDPRRAGRGRKRVSVAPRPAPAAPALVAHDLSAALHGAPELAITARTTGAEADAAFRRIASLDQCTLGVMRFSGRTPWERHPDGDELLLALEGEADVTVLSDGGPVHTAVRAGSVFVCPRGLWHRQLARPRVAMLYGTPVNTTQISFAEDPRHESRR